MVLKSRSQAPNPCALGQASLLMWWARKGWVSGTDCRAGRKCSFLLFLSLQMDIYISIHIFYFFFSWWKSVWEALSASQGWDLWDNPHWSRQLCCVSKFSSFSSLDGKRLTWSSQNQSYQGMALQLPGRFLASRSVQLFHLLRLWVQKSPWDITFICLFPNFPSISNWQRKRPCGA